MRSQSESIFRQGLECRKLTTTGYEISVGFIRTEDPCIQFKMAAGSLARGFSRWQFVVLGRKTQVFNTVNHKKNF